MQYIDFKVQHQTITRTDNYEVVGNSENYLYARFEFCAEWDDIIPTAVFSANNGKHISVLIENGECLVPWEMLRVPEFWVGVFGGDRQTTDTARVGVKPGVKFNARPGVEPTPTAYEKLMNELRDGITQMEEHAENVEGNAEEAAASAEDAAASAAIAENSAATADSAKDVVLNALNNVPAGSTVIVNDLTTGGTSAALSAEMGKVLNTKKANANLLHNWYFGNPVNQRGQTEYTAGATGWAYSIDRWKMTNATLTKADGFWKFATAQSGYKRITQLTEHTLKAGEVYTLSMLARVNGVSVAAFRPCTSGYGQITTTTGGTGITIRATTTKPAVFIYTFTPSADVPNVGVELLVSNTSAYYADIDIYAIKLEKGDVQTLAHQNASGNWVLNEIPDYGEELAKCQRHFLRLGSDTYGQIGLGTVHVGGVLSVRIHTPTVMRIIPTMTLTGNIIARNFVDGTYQLLTPREGNSVNSYTNPDSGVVVLYLQSANAEYSLTPNTMHTIQAEMGGYIDLSADL